MLRMLCFVGWLAATALSGVTPTARAETGEPSSHIYLVLPITRNDEHLAALSQVATHVDRILGERGRERIPFEAAAEVFRQRHSREPQAVSPTDVERLLRESRAVMEAVTERRNHEALEHMDEVQNALDGARETVNRDAKHARTYFEACVAQVRALVGARNLVDAKQAARRCRTNFPELKPVPSETPPPVMAIFEELDRELSTLGGILSVNADRRCMVYLQGQSQHETPFSHRGVVGEEYRVQVGCDQHPGRVYTRVLRDSPTHVFVDTYFDQAIRTSDDTLRLTYEQPDPDIVKAHAQQIATALRPSHLHIVEVFTVAISSDGTVTIQRIGGHSMPLSTSYKGTDLEQAVDVLLAAPTADLVTSGAEAAGPFPSSPVRPGAPSRWLLPTGIGAATLGVAGIVLAATRFRTFEEDGQGLYHTAALDPTAFRERLDEWHASRRQMYGWGAAGTALASVGAAFLGARTPRDTRRWLGPVLGTLGSGLVVAGIVQIVRGGACDPASTEHLRHCLDRQERRDLGGLLTLAGIPLLAPPVVMLATKQHDAPRALTPLLTTSRTSSTVGVLYRF